MVLSKPIRFVVGIVLIVTMLMGCNHDLLVPARQGLVGADGQKSGGEVWLSAAQAATLHNELIEMARKDFSTPEEFLACLPEWLDENLDRVPGGEGVRGQEVVAWLDRYAMTPNELLRAKPDGLYVRWERMLDDARREGLVSDWFVETIHAIVARFRQGDVSLVPMRDLVAQVECRGVPAERQLVGVMLGSATFWQETLLVMSPGGKRVLGDLIGFVIGFVIDTLYGLAGGLIGVVLSFVMSFFWLIAQIAEDLGWEGGDYPHWGTHHVM